ncbi:MAG TPA: LPS export ABC transporter periplasmic protein LptC, partial [Planctomycetota bacterium]|nr:LPS export ABC transporter periplasmic protein LptC [Planctomycetota bacterium]
MVRRILLAGIFLVALVILIYALSLRQDEEPAPPLPAETDTGPKRGFKFDKYDDQNNHVAVFTGKELRGSEDGPNDMIEPKITLVKDKNVTTVITADWGRVDSRSKKKMGNARLRGNVVMTVTDRRTGDATVLRCEEMVYEGVEERVVIPDAVTVSGETMELTGQQLTTDRTMGLATLERDVRLVMKKAAEGMLTRLDGATQPAAPPGETRTEPVIITCDGKALFHRNIYRATFERNVVAVQG